MTIVELIVTAACSNVGAVILTRLWSRIEHKETEKKLTEIHVLVNGRLSEALQRIKHLESELEKAENGTK